MRKIKVISLMLICLISIVLSGCLNITINNNSTSNKLIITGESIVEKGSSIQLSIEEESDRVIEWISADKEIASVNSNGVVTGVSVGTVTIIARDENDTSLSGRISIKVVNKKIEYTNEAPTKIDIYGKNSLYVGESYSYKLQTEPLNASQDVKWISSNEDILTVNNTGVVKAINEGDAVISCVSNIDNSVKNSIHIETIKKEEYVNYEQQVIKVIDETKKSIFGVGNYSLDNNGEFIFSSFGSGFVYNCFPIINGNVERLYNEDDLKKAESFYCYLLTNRHVVEDADKLTVYIHMIDEEVPAELIGFDKKEDIAIVGFKYDEFIKPLVIADSEKLVAGQTVIAIGNPAGFEFSSTATLGIISSPKRYYSEDTDGDGVKDWQVLYIQHDAAINPGNSGGPLLNMYGEVIGINTMKFASTTIENMGFSIPSFTFVNLISYIESGKEIKRVTFGLSYIEVQKIISNGLAGADLGYIIPNGIEKGIYVTQVSENGLAGKAGIKVNDILVKINGESVSRGFHIQVIVNNAIIEGEETVVLTVLRDGTYVDINVSI